MPVLSLGLADPSSSSNLIRNEFILSFQFEGSQSLGVRGFRVSALRTWYNSCAGGLWVWALACREDSDDRIQARVKQQSKSKGLYCLGESVHPLP